MSRIEKFGRRNPIEKAPAALKTKEPPLPDQREDLPPRGTAHPSLQPRLAKLLLNVLMILFIVLACSLFLWGRSLFTEEMKPDQAALLRKGD